MIFTFIFLIWSNACISQNIVLSDLTDFVKKDVPTINEILLTKGWEYLQTRGGNIDKISTWAYEMSADSTAKAWLKVESNPKYLNIIILQFFNNSTYTKLLNSIKALGAKKIHSEVDDDGKILSRFTGKIYVYELSTLGNRHKLVVFNSENFMKSLLEGLEEAGAKLDTIKDTN